MHAICSAFSINLQLALFTNYCYYHDLISQSALFIANRFAGRSCQCASCPNSVRPYVYPFGGSRWRVICFGCGPGCLCSSSFGSRCQSNSHSWCGCSQWSWAPVSSANWSPPTLVSGRHSMHTCWFSLAFTYSALVCCILGSGSGVHCVDCLLSANCTGYDLNFPTGHLRHCLH